jgi:NADPH:quinone reductase-like Zn-dependent oxidoreductase
MVYAIGVTAPGGPDDLVELDVAPEPLGRGQVRVQVAAAAVNHVDAMMRSRPRQGDADQVLVPGMEVAGVVVEVGADVDRTIAPGVRVMAIVVPSGEHGGYRADVVVPAASVALVPDDVTLTAAATVPMGGLTAQLALDRLDLPSGAVIAVTGAAGTVGGYTVQLAKLAGLDVVADASGADEEFVRACGADVVIPRGADFAAAVRRHHPDGVHGVVDCAGIGDATYRALRAGATAITLNGVQSEGPRGITASPVFVHSYATQTQALRRLAAHAGAGRLTPRVAGEVPAARAGWAHHQLAVRGARGRHVLRFA